MDNNQAINTAGNLNHDLLFYYEFKFDNNNSDITPSLSDYELQKIKEDLGMLDGDDEFDNSNLPLPSIYVDGRNTPTPFDFPLTEDERALLEQCTIGSPRRFSDSPSVCSTSLELLADSLIKDFEDMDSDHDQELFFAADEEHRPAENTSASSSFSKDVNLKTPSPLQGENLQNFQRAGQSSNSEALESNEDKKENFSKSVLNTNDNESSASRPLTENADTSSNSASTSSRQESGQTSRSPSLDSDSLPASIDSGLPVKDVHIPQHQYFVVVAIDFGTTFSGYAFAFTRDPESVHMMRRWEGGDPGVTNQKTPTTLLLKPDGSFHSFGFGARDFYHDLEPDDAKKWMYFEKFKMSLHTNKVQLSWFICFSDFSKSIYYILPLI